MHVILDKDGTKSEVLTLYRFPSENQVTGRTFVLLDGGLELDHLLVGLVVLVGVVHLRLSHRSHRCEMTL